MNSLVALADYASSSGSESESEARVPIYRREKQSEKQQNLLTSQDTSDLDSDDYQKKDLFKQSLKKTAIGKYVEKESDDNGPLPLPQGFSSSESSEGTKNLISLSVFANPFEQARQDQLSILEKHVKLKEQEKPESADDRGNKKMCFKFQKGKCRFGDTCKFSHGADHKPVVLTGGNQEPYPSAASGGYMGAPFQDGYYQDSEGQGAEEEEETVRKRRKERAGLSEKLVPSKKAMRIYNRHREQDRPWTTKR
nr:uncharacterized protein LOC129276085 [Lytechinus pictus]